MTDLQTERRADRACLPVPRQSQVTLCDPMWQDAGDAPKLWILWKATYMDLTVSQQSPLANCTRKK